MKQFIIQVFGQGQDLTALQMSLRGIVMFFITLILIRIGGLRIFGKRDAFDNIIAIMMGALLSRGVTGASSFIGVIAATTLMVLVHRLLAWSAVKNKGVEGLVKGKSAILYTNGKIITRNLIKTSMSIADLMESLRLETQRESLEEVETAIMETNGRISFILKKTTGL
jgi:uncharacterized membrane protein YcaP (DUF421 family)